MTIADYLRAFFRRRAPVPPVLVRARIGTVPVDDVVVNATWSPFALRRTYRAKNSQGLCAIPWITGAEHVELTVCGQGHQAKVGVSVDAAREGRVFEVALE